MTVIVAAALALGAAACKRDAANKPGSSAQPAASAKPAAAVLRVAPTHQPMKLDGELNEPVWNAASARTGPFVDAQGGEARPYSDARFLWDADNLYVALYAADDDIRANVTTHDGPVWTDDAFALRITPAEPAGAPTYLFDISPAGVVTDAKRAPGGKDDVSWESGIKLGVDKDGTLNDSRDLDEEWVVEAAIPLRSMGAPPKPGTRLLIELGRCDTPRNTKEQRCGSWGTAKEPRVIELAP
jgi:hypothetical protein